MPIVIPNDEDASDLAKLTPWILQATYPVVECPVDATTSTSSRRGKFDMTPLIRSESTTHLLKTKRKILLKIKKISLQENHQKKF